jgi:DNA-binding NarL/FixJ family response regulator
VASAGESSWGLPESAAELRRELGAERVALVRFVGDGRHFEVVGHTGRGFLAAGARSAADAATILAAARTGECGWRTLESAARPLDHVAVSMGLRSSCSIPVRAGERVIGALAVMWETDRPPIDDPARVAMCADARLLAALAIPSFHEATVLVCHEQELVGRGVACMAREGLGARADVCVSLAEALAAIAAHPPGLVVCSDRFGAERSLAELVGDLRAAGADAPLLVVTAAESARSLAAARCAGAAGYVPVGAPRERLAATMRGLLEGERALDTEPPAIAPGLTQREREILRGVDRGLSDKELARELGVSLSTVKTHARRMYVKLGVNSRTAALHRARCSGLL